MYKPGDLLFPANHSSIKYCLVINYTGDKYVTQDYFYSGHIQLGTLPLQLTLYWQIGSYFE